MNSRTRPRRRTDQIISLGSPKEAALYYDRVLPIDFAIPQLSSTFNTLKVKGLDEITQAFGRMAGGEVPGDPKELSTVLNSLSRGEYKLDRAYRTLTVLNLTPIAAALCMFAERAGETTNVESLHDARRSIEELGIDYDEFAEWLRTEGCFNSAAFVEKYQHRYQAIVDDAGMSNAPVWHGQFASDLVKSEGKSREENFAIFLHDLDLVDASHLTWEQIVAFRNDPDHMNSLRDLRVYFDTNFAGVDPSLVKDRLEQAIEEHQIAARYWGFDTVKKTFAVASTRGNLALTGMTGIASAFAGAPIAAAALAGAAVTVGSCALEFAQIYVDERKSRLRSPLRFLTRLDETAEESTKKH